LRFLAADAAKSILGQGIPIDNDRQKPSWPRLTWPSISFLEPRSSAVEQFHRAARHNPIVNRAEHQREQPSDNDAPDQPIDPHA
jgi:hypothetical protein